MENDLNRHISTNIHMQETVDIQTENLIKLISEIKRGEMRIPNFQRAFVWQIDQIVELLDSVQKGIPIGSILIWDTTENINEHDPLKLGLNKLDEGQKRKYLLDGQQRLVTLYAVLHNNLQLGKKRLTQYDVYYDLKKNKFEIHKKKDVEDKKIKIEEWFLPMNKLMIIDYNIRSVQNNNEIWVKFGTKPEILQSYNDLYNKFINIKIPAIITSQKLKYACSIFEKLNNTGVKLTIVDLMVATTYNQKFNLREKLKILKFDLDNKDFLIDDRTVLQCMSACLQNGTTRDHIIDSKNEIETKWKKTIECINLSIDFLKDNCFVPVSSFLPNEILLAPLSYFFFKFGNKEIPHQIIKKLKRYFWFSVLSQRYNQSQDSKVEEDIKNMDKLLKNLESDVFDYYVQKIDADTIKNEQMSLSSSFAKTMLCFFASRNPLEFKNNTPVKLDLTFADANLKQLHHIFPQNFIKQETKEGDKLRDYTNSIANISLISQVSNREIWDTKPSIYFAGFLKTNKELSKALKSHLIEDLESFGLTKDNFNLFLDKRSKAIAENIDQFVKTL